MKATASLAIRSSICSLGVSGSKSGNFHGATDALLVAGGSGVATLGLPGTAGVPNAAVAETMVVPYNQVPTLDESVACVIVEPVAANMGVIAPRPGFLEGLRDLCDRHGALLIFDEVQTGLGATGRMWAFELFGMVPDIVCFAKKVQVGGILASRRIEEVKDHVFELSSRINSTWGGNLVDMVRAQRYLEIIEEESDKLAHEIEPDPESLLKALVPKAAEVQVFRALLENQAGEHAARMTAMENATRNSEELIDSLTLQFNRARQAAITRELDDAIGTVTHKLDQLGLRENTLVFFIGDNGTHPDITTLRNGVPVRGGKWYTHDAATHVPFLVQWKGLLLSD